MCERCLAFHDGRESECSCSCRQTVDAGPRRARQGISLCLSCSHYVVPPRRPVADSPLRIRDLATESQPEAAPPGSIVPTVPISTALRILSLHFESSLDRDIATELGVSQAVVAAVIARAYRHYHVDRPGTGVATSARQLWEGSLESARAEAARRVA